MLLKSGVTKLSTSKAALLDQLGLAEEKGQLAGNSISSRMTEAVARAAGSRLAMFQTRRLARDICKFSTMSLLVCPKAVSVCAIFLVVSPVGSQSVVVWEGAAIPGMVSDVDQGEAFKMDCNWAEELGFPEASERCILLEQQMGCSRARAIIYYGMDVRAAVGASCVMIGSLLGSPLGVLSVAALAHVQRMRSIIEVNLVALDDWESRRVAGSR